MRHYNLYRNRSRGGLPLVVSEFTTFSAKAWQSHAGEFNSSNMTGYGDRPGPRIRTYSADDIHNVVNRCPQYSFTGIAERELYRFCKQACLSRKEKDIFYPVVSALSYENQRQMKTTIETCGTLFVYERMFSSIGVKANTKKHLDFKKRLRNLSEFLDLERNN